MSLLCAAPESVLQEALLRANIQLPKHSMEVGVRPRCWWAAVCVLLVQGTKGPGKSMQLQKTRIILDDEGIRRLEPGGHDNLLRQKHGRFPHAAGALRKMRFRSSMEAPLTAG